jgi:imidazolonepropionase-like amidohydrolase
MKKIAFVFCFLACISIIDAQEHFPVNGVVSKFKPIYAFTHAEIHVNAKTTISDATLLVQGNKILGVGNKVSIPKDAIVKDLKGKHIYPGFIDLYSSYGIPAVKKSIWSPRPQITSSKTGAFGWNEAIHPEINAVENFTNDEKSAKELRALGFTTVLTHQQDGIMRGTGALINLTDESEVHAVLNTQTAAFYSFQKGSSRQNYPSSLMGSIALLKQTYMDAQWYKSNKGITDLSLTALNSSLDLPQIFEADDKYNILRADLIGDAFNTQYVFKGNGNEYARAKEIKQTGGAVIIPLNFPMAYDIGNPHDARLVDLADLKHWEYAPANAKILVEHNIPIAITTSDLKSKKTFLPNLKKAVKYGLPESAALAALTESPAKIIGESDRLGMLKMGFIANFIITSDNIFTEGEMLETWVSGKSFVQKKIDDNDFSGLYDLSINDYHYDLNLTLNNDKYAGKILLTIANDSGSIDTSKVAVKVSINNQVVSVQFETKDAIFKGQIRLAGLMKDKGRLWVGSGKSADNFELKWAATWKSEITKKTPKKEDEKPLAPLGPLWMPNMAYGFETLPKTNSILIKNVTVWTSEKEGIMTNTDVLLENGKISRIDKNISFTSATVIDGTGKHLTAGIIDEHSHIAISRGVNEGSQASSAEVSIADVINPDNVHIYRQLAGGVVAAQLLHGSANPIGGQSALIKMRYGSSPEAMKIKNADGFIKFALGENVKQSNWGSYNTVRFPQTRMGVEQVYYDHFIRAKEYEKAWQEYRRRPSGKAPRKDLEMETLVEILNKKRFITCHSYVQSEINMLMHVADSMGFTINTFTHILEGYKVADKMKKHGVGASTFSDWWAYKFEVNDAIPYNGALLHSQGIVTAYNSDDAEMGRRLNQEAAKAVKYGGVSEEEAWKFVTLNPAKLLHLDKHMGSIKVGKDADLVLWNNHPLSIYAKPEKTLVDGRVMFDIDTDLQKRKAMEVERERIIQLMLSEKSKGSPTQKAQHKQKRDYHCDSIEEIQ